MDINISHTKAQIKKRKSSVKRFYYIIKDSSVVRGKNRTITVYSLPQRTHLANYPVRVGIADVDTNSYVGDDGCVAQIIAKACNYKHDNYSLKRKDVEIYRLY